MIIKNNKNIKFCAVGIDQIKNANWFEDRVVNIPSSTKIKKL